jgi:hypothetical protein
VAEGMQLIDFILTTHPAYPQLVDLGKEQQKNIHTGLFIFRFIINYNNGSAVLLEILDKLRVREDVESLTELTRDMHMYPDFHGMCAHAK